METVRRYAMFIDGDWVDADDRLEIRSPATEELVATVAKGGPSSRAPRGPPGSDPAWLSAGSAESPHYT